MKTNLMKKALATLAFASLGLMATGAQADGSREGNGYGAQSSYNNHDRNSGHVFQQSRIFSQQINARQVRQMERIKDGMHSGALTRGEFRELMQEQHEIRAMEQRFQADGIIDVREFQRLDHALDLASRNILDEKHDRQARNVYGHNPRFN